MAIFERKSLGKVIVDDTQALTATIESTLNVHGHTEYVIRVERGGERRERHWHVSKRYNDFVALHSAVVRAAGHNIPLPPKKVVGNMEREFISERQKGLQTYLNSVLMNPILASSLGVRRFLDPDTYVLSIQEQAAQHVAMAMRSEMNYELLKPLAEIGWRLRKHYFEVRAKLNPRQGMALQWVEYGPDKVMEERDIHTLLKLFLHTPHALPHIHPLEFVHTTDTGCFVIRLFYPEGSLRDLICGTKPKASFLKKYGSPRAMPPLTLKDIKQYGRQILDGLAFLKEKELPYGHLHTGNVVIIDNQVRLLDVENGVLGLPSYYRPFFVQHKKINSLEAIDVYCFGHVLYEMAVGQALHTSVCTSVPPTCPHPIREVIERILSPEALHDGLPTIAHLQQHALFRDGHEGARGSLRIPSTVRDALNATTLAIERRLRNEQKLVRTQKKISKVQERLTSKDEIQKRQQRLKEERKANHANSRTSQTKSPPRSDSPTSGSGSTATSAGTLTPPHGPSGPGIETVDGSVSRGAATTEEPLQRSALLSSICAFDKSRLRTKSAGIAIGVTNGKNGTANYISHTKT